MIIIKKYDIAKYLLIAVLISSLFSFLGTILNNQILKYITVFSQLFILILSFKVIVKNHYLIKKWCLTIILILAVYPLTRILLDIVGNFSFQKLTDGFIVFGSYYQLIFTGLALALLTTNKIGHYLIYKYSFLALPLGFALMIFSLTAPKEINIFIGHQALTNCFIPVALLSLYPSKKIYIILGWIGLGFIFILSAKIFSRSYTIVGVYIALMAIKAFFSINKKGYGVVLILLLIIGNLIGAFGFFNEESIVQERSIAEKYQFDTLFKSLYRFMEDGDFVKLFHWEGNSRTDVIIDAFSNFSFSDWLIGKGVFGKYSSFENRHTIEIGWAQETFRWGIFYIIFMLWILIFSIFNIKKKIPTIDESLVKLLLGALIVKLFDGFIFGLPQYNVYSLFMFWGIMLTCIKDIKLKVPLNYNL